MQRVEERELFFLIVELVSLYVGGSRKSTIRIATIHSFNLDSEYLF